MYFSLSFAWFSHKVQEYNSLVYYSSFTPVQFLFKETRK